MASYYFNGANYKFKKTHKIHAWPFVCVTLKKNVLKDLRFDENTHTGEDIIFSSKLTIQNSNFYYNPNLIVNHHFPSNFITYFLKQYKYAKDFSYLAIVLENYNTEQYYPHRKTQVLSLPLFIISKSLTYASADLKYFKLNNNYLLPAFIHHVAIFLGLYTSKLGFKKLYKS
jgi:hypothetical protein